MATRVIQREKMATILFFGIPLEIKAITKNKIHSTVEHEGKIITLGWWIYQRRLRSDHFQPATARGLS